MAPTSRPRLCFEIILGALERAGAEAADVVQTRVYLVDPTAFDDMARAHGEIFGEIRPVNTTVVIAGLIDPRWLLEIEALAVLSD
jgi:enamine deaminase RidA (YjgF/YER057c/UK114 family)